jgi:hypothetical protein
MCEQFKRGMLNADFARACAGFDSHDIIDWIYQDLYQGRPGGGSIC